MLAVPILLITFNRPDYVSQVLSAIKKVLPQDLYIFQDGPRNGSDHDSNQCAMVRSLLDDLIDWNCNIHTFFSKDNLGCGPGPAIAISWFFDNVDQGIILEDDAVPNVDFFHYASELLEKYRSDSSVCAIGSMNVDTQRWGDGSYYFSMMNRNLCAWATWKRVWSHFDIQMRGITRYQLNQALRKYHCGVLEREYWCDRLDEVHKDCCGGKSWDMQFFMSIWMQHGKGIIPNVNLSSNIGTVGEATHSMSTGNIIDNVPTSPILPLEHPSTTNIQHEADRQFHYLYFEPYRKDWKWYQIAYYFVNKRIKKLVGHQGPWLRRNR